MVSTEEDILELLSKSERTVYMYIKEKAEKGVRIIKESMKEIGDKLGVSEATVHRSLRKLRKQGVIGIIPSAEKSESNEIVYYGIPDPLKQAHDIFEMIHQLNLNAKRFEEILKMKDNKISQLMRDKETLYARIDELEQELALLRAQSKGFDGYNIVSSQPLDDGTIAVILRKNKL